MNELFLQSREAIRSLDDIVAKKLLKEWQRVLESQNLQNSDPALFANVQKLIVPLKIVAFPNLPENEALDVLRNHYLESFDIEVPMDNRLTIALFSQPDIPRDRLRERYKRALAENQQKLGLLSVSQWIAEFEKTYPEKTRPINASVEFSGTNKNALLLNQLEKNKLKELIHTYDYFLITTLPATGPLLNEIINSDISPYQTGTDDYGGGEISDSYAGNEQIAKMSPKSIHLYFNDALKKYPDLGEQLITSSRIKLKSFPEPVRPSIKNWISDYTFNAGYESHNSMALGNYLYQNENAQKLNAYDRQRLAYILKAYDENAQVSVNEKTKQIMFPLPQNQTAFESNTPFPAINNSQPKTIQNDAIVDLRNRPEEGKSEPKDIFSNFNTLSVGSGLRPEPELRTMRFKSGDLNRPETGNRQPVAQIPIARNFNPNPKKPIRRFAAQPDLTFSSPHKLPFEQSSSHSTQHITHNTSTNTPVGSGLPASPAGEQPKPNNSRISRFNSGLPRGEALRGELNRHQEPFDNSPDNSLMAQPNILKPALVQPTQPIEQKSAAPQPLIISPRRRYKQSIPDYNVVNLKDKK